MEIFLYFFLTLLIEMPVVCLCYRNQLRLALLTGLLLNTFTWPLLHFVLEFVDDSYLPIIEIMIVLVEAIGYKLFLRSTIAKAFIVSLLVNGISYSLSFIIK